MRGQATLAERGAAGVFREPRRARPPKPAPVATPPLTRRQYEVLAAIARGLPYREVAARLGITRKTLEHHATRIADRLGLYGPLCVIRYATTGRCTVLLTELSARYGASSNSSTAL